MHEDWREKFWARVSKSDPDACWEWSGTRLPSGYGCFYPTSKKRTWYAHRVSWEMANDRPIPAGLCVMHSCDNPPCVNPSHLSVGTRSDNMQDMLRKGRGGHTGSPGEQHPQHKLTDNKVKLIRKIWSDRSMTQGEIAALFGVSKVLIGLVVLRKCWKHVP